METDLSGKRIMVAVLNWGLGHATRSVPIIRRLITSGATVILAGDGAPLRYLREIFPSLDSYVLPAYHIRYPSGSGGAWKTVFQAPAIIRAIRQERKQVGQMARELALDAIISDNRYGAHAEQAVSIFLCHQLRVLPPKGFRWGAPVIFRWHKSFFSRFDQIWIPDFPGENNLSGILSHELDTGMPTYYIGPQSRFQSYGKSEETHLHHHKRILALLSGPEPQRSHFEELVKQQLKKIGKPAVLIRGVVDTRPRVQEDNLLILSYVQQNELADLLESAEVVICRPGYSTLMDLALFGKKLILIPTPGQTEQEYLAERLAQKGYALLQRQNHLNLKAALENLTHIWELPGWKHDTRLLDKALAALAEAISKRSLLKKQGNIPDVQSDHKKDV